MTDHLDNLDARLVRRSFDKAAQNYEHAAILQKTVADRLLESFELLNMPAGSLLELGSGTGYGAKQLKRIFKKGNVYQLDLSLGMLNQSRKTSRRFFSKDKFVCANANRLPFDNDCFDVVFSNLMLQWCSDLDSVFTEVNRVLKDGGLFIFSSFGPDSLKELRESWRKVDEDIHVNTFIDMHDVGDSLLRNGIREPVLSVEHIQLMYDEAKTLMHDLKAIGAQNNNQGRRKGLTGKRRLQKMLQHYEHYRKGDKLPATYEVIYGHAWKSVKRVANPSNSDQIFSVDTLRESLKNSGNR